MATRLEDANSNRHDLESRYQRYEELRTPSGVLKTDTLIVVTSYQLAREVLRHADIYGSNVLEIQGDTLLTGAVKRSLSNPLVAKIVEPIPTMMNEPLIFNDGERHTVARAAIAPSMRPPLVEPMRDTFLDIATSLLARKSRTGRMDVVKDFAAPLSMRVTLGLFGIAEEHDGWINRQLQPTVERGRGASFMEGLIGAPRMAASQRRLRSFFLDKVLPSEERENTPLLGAVKKRASVHGPEVAMAEFIQLLVGGTETTQNLVVNGVHRLLLNPTLQDRIRSEKLALPSFRQEVLRHNSPSQVMFRLTHEDVQLADVTIAKGKRLAIVVGAANRDPSVFSSPAEFDTDRFDHAGHPVAPQALAAPLSFGEGVHACPGYFLAGAEADAAWTVLLSNLRGLSLASKSLRTESGLASSGLTSLPVTFEPVSLGRSTDRGPSLA